MASAKYVVMALLALIGIGAGLAVAQRSPSLIPPTVETQAESTEAQAPVAIPTAVQPPSAPELTAEDLNDWLDGLMPTALASADIAGAVVVVVRDGQVLTQRGFGFADVESRRPVDPETTLFRPGSVSKLFTWTAVMQLVEQGRIDLDADVNTYLDFAIPPRDGQPVTMRHIMTHTAGFEEQIKNIIGYTPERVPTYQELLKAWVPERVFAPGTTPAYSNYATSLAGYIVERVSGEPFNAYVERHIFAPLGMANSSFAQPLPERMRPMLATGYQRASGETVPFEYVGPAPAGALSSTGADMARFMIAHLNQGAGLLRPETARTMHRTPHIVIPHLNSMMLGFYETTINGRRAIGHGGDTVAFHSDLELFIDDNVGLFVSVNSGGREGASLHLRYALFRGFADRYFPAPRDERRVPEEEAREHAQMLAGTYTNSRGAFSSFMRILELLGQTKVSVDKDGRPVVPVIPGPAGEARKWVEVQPFVWQELGGHDRLAAVAEDGRITRFGFSSLPFMMFDRTPWYRNSALLLPLLIVSMLVLGLTAIFWPVRALVRRRFGATLGIEGRDLQVYRISRIAALMIFVAMAAWLVGILSLMGNIDNLSSASDPLIIFLQILSTFSFILGFLALAWNLWVTWRGGRRWTARLWSVLLFLAAGVMLWIGLAFNLVGFGTSY